MPDDIISFEALQKTLDEQAIRREELYRDGAITEAEYNHLYVMAQDIKDLLNMGLRWTVHLMAEIQAYERGEK